MNKRTFITVFLSAALPLACQQAETEHQPVEPAVETSESDRPSAVSGTLNVRFTSEAADRIAESLAADASQDEVLTKALANTCTDDVRASMQELGIVSLDRIFPYAGKWEARHREAGLHTWYRVTYDENVPHTKAAASLEDIPGVAEVEVPQKMQKLAIPFRDPFNHDQWGLFNDGSRNKYRKGMDINVIPVWEKYTAGSKEVTVAIVDGGIEQSHPDLYGVVIPPGEEGSASFIPGLDHFTITGDAHGTHVGGIIAAANNNGIGISSIAGGSDGRGGVRLLSCQMFQDMPDDKTKGGNSAQAIVWGADHGAVISQNSWGYVYDTEEEAKRGNISSAVRDAVDYFIRYAGFDENGRQTGPMAGGVVIFAAGNDSFSIGWPAAYEPVIAVGAIRPNGRITSYSNFGPWVDICAPGGDDEGLILSTYPGGQYAYMAGTSQACPHVSGVAALLVSHFGGPGFTNDKLKDMLLLGANYSAPSAKDGIGPMLDAAGAFNMNDPQPPVISTDAGESVVLKSHESTSLTFKVSPSLSVPVKSSVTSDCPALSSEISSDGLSIRLTVNALDAQPGSYRAAVRAQHTENCAASRDLSITILENHAPKLTSEYLPSMIVEKKSEKLSVDMTRFVKDEDGEVLKYSVESGSPDKISVNASGNTLIFSPNAFGETTFTITVSDARGESVKLNPFTFVAFDRAGQEDGFTAYPNPVADVLRLYTGIEREMLYSLMSPNGQTVMSGSVTGSVLAPAKLDFSSLAPGRYALTLSFEGESHTKTIVKR